MSEGPIFTVNAGSSSIKFAAFSAGDAPQRIFTGQVERIGSPRAAIVAQHVGSESQDRVPVGADSHENAGQVLADYVRQNPVGNFSAVAHRVVHGGTRLLDHQRITPEVVAELRRAQPLDMTHLPREIGLIEAFSKAFPSRPQVACFDTAFHRDMPSIARLLPIPRQYTDAGIRRFGFHGLSYTYLLSQLKLLAGADAANGRVLLAHLGAGASMAAVRDGKPVDTTMAFTPTAGLVMATRPGDLDPGLLLYLVRQEKMTADELDQFISARCGLIGVSQSSSDMRDLLAARGKDPRAAEAVSLFCYAAKKQLCALAATVGGIDTLVFSAGIGEHVPEVRSEICSGLEFLGIAIDPSRNEQNAQVISADDSRVTVRVIPTDEESVMARIAQSILAADSH